jgi:hypothetical protein
MSLRELLEMTRSLNCCVIVHESVFLCSRLGWEAELQEHKTFILFTVGPLSELLPEEYFIREI